MDKQRLEHGLGWAIVYSTEGVTSYPFKTERWHDGEGERHNHPCVDLVAEPQLIESLPEVVEYPFLLQVLRALNAAAGSVRSTQCTPGLVDNTRTGTLPPFFAGATVHVAYRDSNRNAHPHDLVELARKIVAALPRESDSNHPVRFCSPWSR